MENYYEAYRKDSTPLLKNTIAQFSQTTKNAEDTVPMNIQRKK